MKRVLKIAAACIAATAMFSGCDELQGIDPNENPDGGILTINDRPSGEIGVQIYQFTDVPENVEEAYQMYLAHLNVDNVVAVGASSSPTASDIELTSLSDGRGYTGNGVHAILFLGTSEQGEDLAALCFGVNFTDGNATVGWLSAFGLEEGTGGGVPDFTITGYSSSEEYVIIASTEPNLTSFVNLALASAGRGVIATNGEVTWVPAPATGSYTLYIVEDADEDTDVRLLKRTSYPVPITYGHGVVPYSAFVDIEIGGGEFSENDVVGTWEYQYGGFAIMVYEFNADKTGLTYVPIPIVGGREDEEEFTWEIRDGEIKNSRGDEFIYINDTKIMHKSTNLEFIKTN